jgi:putative transposase|tara:strand:+ start:571 stop:1419 length:849 start_codon:yes stop_codon:yes gene_type:complete
VVTLAEKQQSANYLQDVYSVSERRACQVLSIHRNTKRAYEHKEYANEMEEVIIRLSEQEPRWGYRKVYDRMKLDGYRVGRESVRLVRKREGLQVRRKQHKKHYPGPSSMLAQASRPNHVWTYDFVMDQTMDSRRLKFLTVADEFTRQGLAIECARSITAKDVIRILSLLFAIHGRPAYLRSDNGPEFIASELQQWLLKESVATHYIEPGSPWQNGYGESFNAIVRDDCLNRWAFYSVKEANLVAAHWLHKYNDYRPHGSLSGLTPNLFVEQWSELNAKDEAA